MITRLLILFAIAVTSLKAYCNEINPIHTPVKPGKPAHTSQYKSTTIPGLPRFQIVNEEGTIIQLSDFKGKKIFVNLWATWCPPCRAELASIQKLYRSVDTAKVVFVLLSVDKNFEIAKKYKKFKRLKVPIYYPAEDLPELFYVQGIPTTFIFNENGDLVQQIDGGEDYNTKQYKQLLGS